MGVSSRSPSYCHFTDNEPVRAFDYLDGVAVCYPPTKAMYQRLIRSDTSGQPTMTR
jgi:hypothetical protein